MTSNPMPSASLNHHMRTLISRVMLVRALAIVARAACEPSTVLGTVKDRSDAVVGGATVTLANLDTNITAVKQTDENGAYEFVNVRPGRYKLTAEKSGF